MTNNEKYKKILELKKEIISYQLEKKRQERLSKISGVVGAACLTALPVVSNSGINDPLIQTLLTGGLLVSGIFLAANYLDYPNEENKIDYKIAEKRIETVGLLK